MLVPHRGVASNLFYFGRRVGVNETDRQLQFFSPQFDGAAAEMWLPLMRGATLVLPPEETIKIGREFVEMLLSEKISFVYVLPNVLQLLALYPSPFLRSILVCGEACPADIVGMFRAQNPHTRIFNAYGPTEASICTSASELTLIAPDDLALLETAPIGKPLPMTTSCTLFSSSLAARAARFLNVPVPRHR